MSRLGRHTLYLQHPGIWGNAGAEALQDTHFSLLRQKFRLRFFTSLRSVFAEQNQVEIKRTHFKLNLESL